VDYLTVANKKSGAATQTPPVKNTLQQAEAHKSSALLKPGKGMAAVNDDTALSSSISLRQLT
jgi:hypothetical protein